MRTMEASSQDTIIELAQACTYQPTCDFAGY